MVSNSSEGGVGRTKVDRVIGRYGLEELGDELERRWLGSGNTKQNSTRELAHYFNKAVLRAVIKESETFTLSGDVEEVYRTLTEDESADATLVKSRLEGSGIDVETVMNDFISHQTVYRYLKDHRGVERPKQSTAEKVEKAIGTIQRLQGRTIAVTEQKIQTFESSGLLSGGEFTVLNDIQIICEACGRSHDVTSFFEQGGCECNNE